MTVVAHDCHTKLVWVRGLVWYPIPQARRVGEAQSRLEQPCHLGLNGQRQAGFRSCGAIVLPPQAKGLSAPVRNAQIPKVQPKNWCRARTVRRSNNFGAVSPDIFTLSPDCPGVAHSAGHGLDIAGVTPRWSVGVDQGSALKSCAERPSAATPFSNRIVMSSTKLRSDGLSSSSAWRYRLLI